MAERKHGKPTWKPWSWKKRCLSCGIVRKRGTSYCTWIQRRCRDSTSLRLLCLSVLLRSLPLDPFTRLLVTHSSLPPPPVTVTAAARSGPYHHAPRSIRSGPPLGALISLCRPLRSWNSYGHTGASCLGSLLRYSTLDFPIWFLPRVRVAEHAFALAKIRAKELRPSSSVHLLVSLITVCARPSRAIAQLCRSLPNRRNALWWRGSFCYLVVLWTTRCGCGAGRQQCFKAPASRAE